MKLNDPPSKSACKHCRRNGEANSKHPIRAFAFICLACGNHYRLTPWGRWRLTQKGNKKEKKK